VQRYVKVRKRRASTQIKVKPLLTDWKWIFAIALSAVLLALGILEILKAM
jgi:hypothetical protein